VKAHYKMVPKDDSMRCKEMDDSDDTEFECYSRCRMEMIRNVCKCTAATISSLVKDAAELEVSNLRLHQMRYQCGNGATAEFLRF